MTTKERTRENVELGAGVLWIIGLTIGAIFGGSLVHSHFAPKEALCNTYSGQAAQQDSQSTLAHCGIDSFLSQMSGFVHTVGIIVAIGLGILALVGLVLLTMGKLNFASEGNDSGVAVSVGQSRPSSAPAASGPAARLDAVQALDPSRPLAACATPSRVSAVERLVKEAQLHPDDARILIRDGRVDDPAWMIVRSLGG